METVAAIATPPGTGAVALVRVTGSGALEVADRVVDAGRRGAPSGWPVGVQRLARLLDGAGRMLDEALVCVWRAPRSFTGEDLVEISCHGGALVTRAVLEAVLRAGASPAGPGEFTRRAFLNGKIDLTRAEAVMDLIGAQGALALRAAAEQLEGRLGAEIERLRSELLGVLAHLEAHIDFPEEGIEPEVGAGMLEALDAIAGRIGALLATADRGRILREGVRVAICGAPNVGKSSLMNRMLGYERAIVSGRPGTTRDYLEEAMALGGVAVRLVDMAGLREAEDEIEREGVARARRILARSDLVLEVVDASVAPGPGRGEVPVAAAGVQGWLLVLNKIDLGEHAGWGGVDGARVSCVTGAGLEALLDAVRERVAGGSVAVLEGGALAINARHQACLRRAAEALGAARGALAGGVDAEFVAVDLRAALDAAGEVVGRVGTEELLGEIFSRFCIGK